MSWVLINRRIKDCKRLPSAQERLSCLTSLYNETHDGMAAYALAEELESQGKLEAALKHFEEAERKFPLPRYKLQAQNAIVRVKMKLQEQKEISLPVQKTEVYPQVDLTCHDPASTLFVVACTKTKIWDEDPSVPLYVPARFAYRGKQFRTFIKWAEENKLEEKGFKWIILSAKYGYIEPWHPIGNYNVTFSDEKTGPISDKSLYSQVMHQKRWKTTQLKNFSKIICFGSKTYINKVCDSFRDTSAQVMGPQP